MPDLPGFPVDDSTLLAVEHALGAAYAVEDGEHRLVGADYSLDQVLDFMAGHDPAQLTLMDGAEVTWMPGVPVYVDERPTYTYRDVIAALIAEVRRLRHERENTDGSR